MSRDCSVRIISPVTGDVITTLLLNPNRGLVDVAYAIEEGILNLDLFMVNNTYLRC